MNRTQKIVAVGTAAMLLVLGLNLNAAGQRERREQRWERNRGERCLGLLTRNQQAWKVTDTQLSQIRTITQEMEALQEKIREGRRLNRQERPGRQMEPSKPRDWNRLKKEMEAQALLRVSQRIQRMELRERLQKVLTEEQRQKLEEALPVRQRTPRHLKNHPGRGLRGPVPPATQG